MKRLIQISGILLLVPLAAAADEQAQAKHREGSVKVADRQDELSADVQQLTIEQTAPKVIELLNEVEKIMDEATDQLAESNTGGATIAAQTEIIEKIHQAAKEKKKQQGSGQAGSAMMDMMERMMGKNPDGEGKGKGKGKDKGDKTGEEAGEGETGLSDAANQPGGGETGGKSEARQVPKASGGAGRALPEEFGKALDAYNRGVEQRTK